MPISERNRRYKDKVLSAPYEICIERARYFTESYRATEGEPEVIRAAKAFSHTLERMSIYVLADESVVGNRSGKLVGAVIPIERGEINTVIELDLDAITARREKPFVISAEDRRELLDTIIPYWRGKTVRDRKKELWKEAGLYFPPSLSPIEIVRRRRSLDWKRFKSFIPPMKAGPVYAARAIHEVLYNNPALVTNVFDVQGHLILGIRNVLPEGFSGIRGRALKRRERAASEGDREGVEFCDAVIICCEAVRAFAKRFADECERLSESEPDAARALELAGIAKRCRRVPYEPPEDFREAVQAMWFVELCAFIAYGMTGIFAVGRIDQYLYPYYRKDRDAGRITGAEARELLEEILIKLSYNLLILPHFGKQTGNELGADSGAPTIGGVARDGSDGTNELSFLVLDAFENVKSLGNSFTIRLSGRTREDFWKRAIGAFRSTSGAALYNDDLAVSALERCGVETGDARDYGVIGCVEPTGDGDTFGCTSGNDISLVAALEMALLNGRVRILGRRLGPKTGDPAGFLTFEEFFEAYKRQAAFLIRMVVKAVDLKDRAYMERLPAPYVSATLAGCIENARDATRGGARYNFGSVGARGFGTAVDSLAAVKHFVYDTKKMPMKRLLALLDTNFKGAEPERAMLASRGPRYGADDDRADAIAKELASFFCDTVSGYKNLRGSCYRPGFFSYGMHVIDGLMLGATPDGRRAGEPVSNSFSPSNGSERGGPTAVMRSISKVDHTRISNGCAVNMKFLPSLFEGEERAAKMESLFKAYFSLGGMEIQPNVVSNATLRDAQAHPERYRDLVVRVSGYSALFTDLGRPVQDEIISRTEFGELG